MITIEKELAGYRQQFTDLISNMIKELSQDQLLTLGRRLRKCEKKSGHIVVCMLARGVRGNDE
jgi:hypothetical protein